MTIFEYSCVKWKESIDAKKKRQKELETAIRKIGNAETGNIDFPTAAKNAFANGNVENVLPLMQEYYEIDGEIKAAERLSDKTNGFMQDSLVSFMIMYGGSRYVS